MTDVIYTVTDKINRHADIKERHAGTIYAPPDLIWRGKMFICSLADKPETPTDIIQAVTDKINGHADIEERGIAQFEIPGRGQCAALVPVGKDPGPRSAAQPMSRARDSHRFARWTRAVTPQARRP